MQSQSHSTLLLASDQQGSISAVLRTGRPHSIAYGPYGHRPTGSGLCPLLGFTGQQPDSLTGHYHLGNGYRQYNPAFMRFNSPDNWGPFREAGVNVYVYCAADPINQVDPTGHVGKFIGKILGFRPHAAAQKAARINNKITSYPYPLTHVFDQNPAVGTVFGDFVTRSVKASAWKNKIYIQKIADNGRLQITTTKRIEAYRSGGNTLSIKEKNYTERLISISTIEGSAPADTAFVNDVAGLLANSKKGLTRKQLLGVSHPDTAEAIARVRARKLREQYAYEDERHARRKMGPDMGDVYPNGRY